MKFYPPYIEGTIPAFCKNKEGDIILKVPFTMNKTVGTNSVWGFALRMKTIQSNQLIYTTQTQVNLDSIREVDFEIKLDDFISPYTLNEGQYYKIQIAYISYESQYNGTKGEVGYFSTVGVVKYTSRPELTIVDMSPEELHSDLGTYVGRYYNQDTSEKLYTYRFDIYDNQNILVASSGEQLHNHEEDIEIDETIDRFVLPITLQDNKFYKIVYSGVTTNGMQVTSPAYRIVQQSSIPPEIEADVIATMNKDNGYMEIVIQGHIDPINNIEKNAIGTFQVLRASEIGGFSDWQVIKRFALFGSPPSQVSIKDFTVEQGKQYQYALQQYNNDTKLLSDKLYSDVVLSDFEDCFLYDGKRQLKIKYNPKISSFKQTLQEAKTVTLGQQYPFILRNGKVDYKEFPISGLISYLMDEEHLFIQDEELGLDKTADKLVRTKTLKTGISSKNEDYFDQLADEYGLSYVEELKNVYIDRELPESSEKLITGHRGRTTNLINYNMAAERIFKLKVLEFLNDGQPKLFRSPGEGNYIVRLMNSSLAPNDQLGRMLHTFSTTATEVEDFSSASLEKIGIVASQEIDTRQRRWETVVLSTLADKTGWVKINTYTAFSLQCLDMLPGSKIRITFSDNPSKPQEIVIGSTGAYYSNLDRMIQTIEVDSTIFKSSLQGQITYGFYGTTFNHFDTYQKININDIPLMQLIGEQKDENGNRLDVKTKLTDVRNKITNFNLLHFIKRDVVPVYKYPNNTFYYAPKYNYSNIISDLTENQFAINFKEYPNEYKGKELITWAPTAPNKQEYWETIYSPKLNDNNKGVINIRSSITSKSVSIDVCYQTNTHLIEFKNYLKEKGYRYLNSVTIIAEDSNDYNGQLNEYLNNAKLDDVIVVNDVNAYSCVKRGKELIWSPLPYKLGTVITIEPSANGWFRIETDEEYITAIKIRLPQLKSREIRDGYLVYETYVELGQISTEGEVKDFDPMCLYKVINNANFTSNGFNEELYFDGNTQEYVLYSNKIELDGQFIDITNTEEYQATNPNEINKVYIPSGVLADIGVQRRTIEYGIESKSKYRVLLDLKKTWEDTNNTLNNILFSNNLYGEEYSELLADAREAEALAYQNYIDRLQYELDILAGQGGNAS